MKDPNRDNRPLNKIKEDVVSIHGPKNQNLIGGGASMEDRNRDNRPLKKMQCPSTLPKSRI